MEAERHSEALQEYYPATYEKQSDIMAVVCFSPGHGWKISREIVARSCPGGCLEVGRHSGPLALQEYYPATYEQLSVIMAVELLLSGAWLEDISRNRGDFPGIGPRYE